MDASRYRKHYNNMADSHPGTPISPASEGCDYVKMLWQKLLDAYIAPNGAREVNLPSNVRDRLMELPNTLVPPHPSELELAVKIIFELMDESVLVPFLNSVTSQRSEAITTPWTSADEVHQTAVFSHSHDERPLSPGQSSNQRGRSLSESGPKPRPTHQSHLTAALNRSAGGRISEYFSSTPSSSEVREADLTYYSDSSPSNSGLQPITPPIARPTSVSPQPSTTDLREEDERPVRIKSDAALQEDYQSFEYILPHSRRESLTNLSDISDASSVATARESIFSLASVSSMSSVHDTQGAIERLVALLLGDSNFKSLCLEALGKFTADRFERNVRRLLQFFALDLQKEAESPQQRSAAHFVLYRARNSAHIIRGRLQTNGDARGAPTDSVLLSIEEAEDEISDESSDPEGPENDPFDLQQLERFILSSKALKTLQLKLRYFIYQEEAPLNIEHQIRPIIQQLCSEDENRSEKSPSMWNWGGKETKITYESLLQPGETRDDNEGPGTLTSGTSTMYSGNRSEASNESTYNKDTCESNSLGTLRGDFYGKPGSHNGTDNIDVSATCELVTQLENALDTNPESEISQSLLSSKATTELVTYSGKNKFKRSPRYWNVFPLLVHIETIFHWEPKVQGGKTRVRWKCVSCIIYIVINCTNSYVAV
jgi:hypothetical protein